MSRRNCQTFSTGLSSGERGGSGRRVMLSGTRAGRDVPSGLVEHQHGMGARSDGGADLRRCACIAWRVAAGHDEAGALALGRADRAEDVGPLGALVVRRARPRAAPGPAAGDLVLLPDPRLVLQPELYGRAGGKTRSDRRPPPEGFFKLVRGLWILRVVPRPGGELGIAHRPQLPAQRLPADREAEALPDPLHEVDEAPAHHAVEIGLRTRLDRRGERRAMLRLQERRLARRLAVDQPGGPSALNRSTQSRTICRVTPPTRAASVREPPS